MTPAVNPSLGDVIRDMNRRVTWPLESNRIREGSQSNTFGYVRNNNTKPHQGWDLEARVGTLCFAVSSGEVMFVDNYGDYGLQVCISFRRQGNSYIPSIYYAFYAHLLTAGVHEGDRVNPDTIIGLTGQSGNAANTPPHLHFEIRSSGARLGRGLGGRIDPKVIFGDPPLVCPVFRSGWSGP